MGWFPCECCTPGEECTCLTIAELPQVTKTGWTADPWTQVGDCCFKTTLRPNINILNIWNETATCVAPGVIQTASFTATCQTTAYTWNNYDQPLWFEQSDPNKPCPIPSELCCPNPVGPVQVGTTSSTISWRMGLGFLLYFVNPSIDVYITKALVDCGGQNPVCKYILMSTSHHSYKAFFPLSTDVNYTRAASVTNNCYSKKPNTDKSSNGWERECYSGISFKDDENLVPMFPPNFESETWYASCIDKQYVSFSSSTVEGFFLFDRIKFLDSMPSGNISFSNSDTLSNQSCSVNLDELCGFIPNVEDDELCIYSPEPYSNNGVLSKPPCFCDSNDLSTLVTIINTFSSRCDNEVAPGQPSSQYTIYQCVPGIDGIPGSCLTINGGCDADVSPCGTFNSNCLPTTQAGLKIFVDVEPSNLCVEESGFCSFDPNHIMFFGEFSVTGEYLNAHKFSCACDPFNTFIFNGCFSENCNSNCCYSFNICEPCNEVNPFKCFSKYVGLFGTVANRTFTYNCSGVTQRGHCFQAPSWTLNFS